MPQKPEAPAITPFFLDVNQSCEALGIRRTLLYRLIGEGRLRATKIGRRTVIAYADLVAFAAEARRTAA
jgi:excisionase family DNA binding protein